jgi:hypothetical protein
VVPNSNTTIAILGNAITSPRTVFTNAAVTVKNIQFDNANTYVIVGAGSVNLAADTGNASAAVVQGSHEFQAIVNLNSATDVDVAAGASLAFNNALNLSGNTLTKTGSGTMAINNALNTGGGSIVVSAGALGGSGEIVGDLTNNGGTVAPGTSPGKLSVAGNYLQTSGSLLIEIDGTTAESQYDVLDVTGNLTMSGGSLDVVMGFTPTPGGTFDILNFAAVNLTGATLNLGTPGTDMAWDSSQLSVDGSLTALSALLGDMNGDLSVTIADVSLFVQALVNRAGYDVNNFPVDADVNGDVDSSGTFDLGDLSAFSALTFSGASSGSVVPEPVSASLLAMALGALALVGYRRRK